MDGSRFDDLIKVFGRATTRRSTLKAIGAVMLGAVGLSGDREAVGAAAKCRAGAEICRKNGDCCSGVCNPADASGRRRCQCPPGSSLCGDGCLDLKSDAKNCGACGVICPSTNCQTGVCFGGVCGLAASPAKVGKPCDDGNLCTTGDVCQRDGSCAGTPKNCASAGDQCNDGACDPGSGQCVKRPKANGGSCNADNNACTNDSCQNGACVAGAPKDCASLSDQCNDGVCDPLTGQCKAAPKADGTGCDDGNACTQTDTCQAGVCVGGNPVVCTDPDQCHDAGTCNAATGKCSEPVAKSDGTTCNADNDACTNDACQEGVCTAGAPKDCSTLSDQCNDGACNTVSGQCVKQPKTNGIYCDDGDACTQTDTCQDGVCTGGNPVTCTALDQCHDAGTCDPATGLCSNPAKTDGEPCNADNSVCTVDACQAGICVAGPATDCSAAGDACNDGVCDPSSGECVKRPKSNGTPCTADGSACTVDTCQEGVCTAGEPMTCPNQGACLIQGVCNAATGACDYQDAPSGTPCTAGDTNCIDGRCCPSSQVCDGDNGPVCCPSGQTCQTSSIGGQAFSACCADGEAFCPIISFADGQFTVDPVCCPSGQTCQSAEVEGQTFSACCANEVCPLVSVVDGTPSVDLICCGSGQTCQTTSFQGLSFSACCENEICPAISFDDGTPSVDVICCPSGQTCQTASIEGQSISACCESDVCPVISFADGQVSVDTVCCGIGQTCQSATVGNRSYNGCCEEDESYCPVITMVDGIPTAESVCCPSGQTCQSTTVAGQAMTACCDTEICPVATFSNGIPTLDVVCCPTDTACSTTTYASGAITIGLCCPPGESVMVDPITGESSCCANPCTQPDSFGFPRAVCCGDDEVCVPSGSLGDFELGTCCAAGQSVCAEFSPFGLPVPNSHICCDNCTPYSDGTPVCCPDGQEVCSVLSAAGSPTAAKYCCDNCQTASDGYSFCCPPGEGGFKTGLGYTCCPAGQSACSLPGPIDVTLGTICCDHCQEASDGASICCQEGEVAWSLRRAHFCVPSDGCPVSTVDGDLPADCPAGTTCATVDFGGKVHSMCCPTGQSAIFEQTSHWLDVSLVPPVLVVAELGTPDTNVSCCPVAQICSLDNGYSSCCAANETCGPSGCVAAG